METAAHTVEYGSPTELDAPRREARRQETDPDDPSGIAYEEYARQVYGRPGTSPAAERRSNGVVFTPPRMAKLAAETIDVTRLSGPNVHVVDACCGFGMLALAVIERIAPHVRHRRRRSAPVATTPKASTEEAANDDPPAETQTADAPATTAAPDPRCYSIAGCRRSAPPTTLTPTPS